jgi:hypothetical protein
MDEIFFDGKIESLRLELNALMDCMSFYIDGELYRQALSSVGEKSDLI